MTSPSPSATPSLNKVAQAMLANFEEQLRMHAFLLEMIRAKREAIRDADFPALHELAAREQQIATAVTEREHQRLRLLEASQPLLPGEEVTVAAIAARVPTELAEPLLAHAATLRETLQTLQAESTVLRDAATRLSDHLAGLVQTVQAALSRAKTYSRTGQLAMNASMDASLDLRS